MDILHGSAQRIFKMALYSVIVLLCNSGHHMDGGLPRFFKFLDSGGYQFLMGVCPMQDPTS